jgi:hypothetical protein
LVNSNTDLTAARGGVFSLYMGVVALCTAGREGRVIERIKSRIREGLLKKNERRDVAVAAKSRGHEFLPYERFGNMSIF